MNRSVVAATVLLAASLTSVVSADVRTEEKSQVKLEGPLGRIMSLFGGKAARDGIVTTVSVKGDRKMTTTDRTAQLVDLKEEKVYEIDLAKKTYTVTTFADLRRQMEEARRKAVEQASRRDSTPPPATASDAPQYEIDFTMKESGQTRAINGFDSREVVMTVGVHEKGKSIDQGGMVMTTSTWLAPKVPSAGDAAAFDRRFAEKLALPTMIDAQQMAQAMAMYPMLADAMKRQQVENVRLDGTPLLTIVKIEAAAPPDQQATSNAAKTEPVVPVSTSKKGFGAALGGRLARKVLEKKDDSGADTPSAPGRTTIMTIQHEVLKITPAATDADVAIPAGFTLKS